MNGGGGGPQEVKQTGDPQLARLNEYATNQVIDAGNQFGGLVGLTNPQSYMFTDFGRPFSGGGGGLQVGSGNMNAPFRGIAEGNVSDPQAPQNGLYSPQPGPETGVLMNMKDFYSRPVLDPYMASGLGMIGQATDPTASTQAAQNIFNSIAAPAIRNNAVANGMGRGGAVNEQLMNAGTQMALPIQQSVMTNQMQGGKLLPMFGQMLNQREGGNLQQLLQLAARPRMEEASAQQAQRNTILGSLGRFPVSSGAGTSTTTGLPGMPDQTGQMVSGLLTSLMSMAMMAAML